MLDYVAVDIVALFASVELDADAVLHGAVVDTAVRHDHVDQDADAVL